MGLVESNPSVLFGRVPPKRGREGAINAHHRRRQRPAVAGMKTNIGVCGVCAHDRLLMMTTTMMMRGAREVWVGFVCRRVRSFDLNTTVYFTSTWYIVDLFYTPSSYGLYENFVSGLGEPFFLLKFRGETWVHRSSSRGGGGSSLSRRRILTLPLPWRFSRPIVSCPVV